jgi:hypothetical protein
MPKHQMQIPHWIWEEAQRKYGVKNPATQLRDLLTQAWVHLAQTKVEAEPEFIDGPGTLWTAQWDSPCDYCKYTIKADTKMVRCDAGNMHIPCYKVWWRNKKAEAA